LGNIRLGESELSVKRCFPKHLEKKVAAFLKKTPDIKVNIAILKFDRANSQSISYLSVKATGTRFKL
jgi:hypothetical protein